MKENTIDFIVATALIFILLLVSGFARPAAGEDRTLGRTEDFVVIAGKDVGELIGVGVDDLRLYSCKGSQCSPIPVQIDKVDVMGRYVFPQDMNFDRDGKKLDENDEISFMAGDAGGGIADGFRPGAAKAGVLSQDVLDRQRVGLEAQTVGDMNMQISVPETIIKSEYAGVIDGPVRAEQLGYLRVSRRDQRDFQNHVNVLEPRLYQ